MFWSVAAEVREKWKTARKVAELIAVPFLEAYTLVQCGFRRAR